MKITAVEFIQRTLQDPNWCSKLTEPLEITEYLVISGDIKSLSPLLTFSGRDSNGYVAHFENCKQLKIAEGTFHGCVGFNKSGIEKIGELKITQTNVWGEAANYVRCKELKIAEGTYPGSVNFSHSGITAAKNIRVLQPDEDGNAAEFDNCPNLQEIRGEFNGKITGNEDLVKDYHENKATKKVARIRTQEPTLEL